MEKRGFLIPRWFPVVVVRDVEGIKPEAGQLG